jgi:SulP family sulfate permease
MGAKTRMAGVFTGGAMLVVLVAFGSVLDHTPLASLAGLMFVVAYDLVDVPRIRRVLRSSRADALAFLATLIGTWVLTLDAAIYLGVGISVVLFLRRARVLRVTALSVAPDGTLQESTLDSPATHPQCRGVRILQIDGPLFFGAAAELQAAIVEAARPAAVRAVIVRLKRAHGLDATMAGMLGDTATMLRAKDRQLLLVGMTPDVMQVLQRSGAAETIGADNLFVTRPRWFSALEAAIARAATLCDHGQTCPLLRWRATARVSAG